MISQTSLEKFKKLYHQAFNEELDDAEALGRANRLLNIYMAVYGDPFDYYKSRQEDIKTGLEVNQNNYHDNKPESETEER